jgi:serine phosphatase RsbU (regulator of sigma subunit)
MRPPGLASFGSVSKRTTITLALILGLLAAFTYATFLSYWGSVGILNAFAYQSAVVAAQRDSELLDVEQFDRRASDADLRPYETLLANDLRRIDSIAEVEAERSPPFAFPATRASYERLTAQLLDLERLGRKRFDLTVRRNTQTRDLSNAMFALVALLFAVIVGRLRRALDEGRSLVEGLQRAFLSRRRDLPGVDIGSVLISATRGSNVGGDTHDAFTLDRKHALFLVADVSGKGVDAAVDTALIKFTIRTLFAEDPAHDPGTIVSKFASIYVKSAENPESFVVLFVAVADLESGTVRYASAGHEPAWAVIGQDVAILPPTGPIVGIDASSRYATREIHLRYGDALVVSTDGLTESRDSRGRLLGAEGVSVWLTELGGSAQGIADAIVKRLRRRSSRIADDLAILVVRYAPSVRPGMPVATPEPEAEPELAAREAAS